MNPSLDIWRIAFTVLAGVIAAALAIIAYRRLRARRRHAMAFQLDCERSGLTGEERELLVCMSNLAGLKHAETIFALDGAFFRGAKALVDSERVKGLSEEGRQYIRTMIDTLRDKLGFHADNLLEEGSGLSSSRNIRKALRSTSPIAVRPTVSTPWCPRTAPWN